MNFCACVCAAQPHGSAGMRAGGACELCAVSNSGSHHLTGNTLHLSVFPAEVGPAELH